MVSKLRALDSLLHTQSVMVFQKIKKCMNTKINECLFFNIPQDRVSAENKYAMQLYITGRYHALAISIYDEK